VQKNPLLAVEALALVRDVPWSLEVIGEGPLGQAMREKVVELKLEDRITFSGWLSGDEVGAKMAQSDVLFMTSLHEGLPMVAVEALHHGLAILGSDIGGMQDVVDEGRNGHLCALTPSGYAPRLREVLSSTERLAALRRGSLEKALDFDFARSMDRYEEVLTEAARGRA
jgi:glycosyltransferase involved in cell wall biosynthesis